MLTAEANDRLTRVGPGTPMGNLLRRYWHPVATSAELAKEPVLAVKLLGENLALYRAPNGELGLMSERCPHRGASMAYGIPENEGLRCPYHGWVFNGQGACVDMPAEPTESTFKHRVRIPAYPVQELGGLIFAYLGPEPAPLLPRWDVLVRDDLERSIGISRIPCSWLQCMENSLDPHHFEWLHAYYGNYAMKRIGKPPAMAERKHVKTAFDAFDYGIKKRRLLEGDTEDSDDWTTGHPILMPNILAVNDSNGPTLQYRVPVDDTNTLHFWYGARTREPGSPPQDVVPIYENPWMHENGRFVVETINGQDMMAWITQGPVSDRTAERLGASDKGIILYRGMLMEQMERVARGEDPIGTVRDPAKNEPMIVIPREGHALRAYEQKSEMLSEVFNDIVQRATR